MDSASSTPPRSPSESGPVVLFDGACNLCNGAVQFIIARDQAGRFQFARLQSVFGRSVAQANALQDADSQHATMVLVSGGKVAFQSDAALLVARQLGNSPLQRLFWRTFATIGLAVPRPLRNLVYAWVARNRRRWFGGGTVCWVPTPELKRRFVE